MRESNESFAEQPLSRRVLKMEEYGENCTRSTQDCHTVELLKECGNGCQMAQKSVKQAREFVKDQKLNDLLESYGEKHTEIEKKVIDMLGRYGSSEDNPGKMAEIGAWMSMEMSMLMHPDEHEAAKKMMDGCNMGIQSVSEYVNKYPDADEEAHEIAKKLIKVEEDFMEEMKEFV